MKIVLIGRGIVRIDYDLCLVRVDFVRRLIVCNSGLWRRGVSSRTVRDSSRAGVRRAMADMSKGRLPVHAADDLPERFRHFFARTFGRMNILIYICTRKTEMRQSRSRSVPQNIPQ